MFRSQTRDVVYPQAEHARLAGALAGAWARELPVAHESFVRGVTEHDRGYGELDDDEIGAVAEERWLEIQRRGFEPQSDDPVVELVVAMHIARLVGGRTDEFAAQLPGRLDAANVDADIAAAVDLVTNLCDRISFDLCVETEETGEVGGIAYETTPDGIARVTPWPFEGDSLAVTITGYVGSGYPSTLDAIPRSFRITQ